MVQVSVLIVVEPSDSAFQFQENKFAYNHFNMELQSAMLLQRCMMLHEGSWFPGGQSLDRDDPMHLVQCWQHNDVCSMIKR